MDIGWVLPLLAGLVLLWLALIVLFWVFRPRDVPVRELARLIPDVVTLLRDVIADRSTPGDLRLVLAGSVVWIVSPIDLIPEFIPGLGPLDDVVVGVAAFRYTRRRLGVERLRRQWKGSEEGLELLLAVIGNDRPGPAT